MVGKRGGTVISKQVAKISGPVRNGVWGSLRMVGKILGATVKILVKILGAVDMSMPVCCITLTMDGKWRGFMCDQRCAAIMSVAFKLP